MTASGRNARVASGTDIDGPGIGAVGAQPHRRRRIRKARHRRAEVPRDRLVLVVDIEAARMAGIALRQDPAQDDEFVFRPGLPALDRQARG